MHKKTLIAWIGNTDLRAARGELPNGVGPIANAANTRCFNEIELLSDHKPTDSRSFAKWLKQQSGVEARLWPVKLTGPYTFR